ncbi:hypothetical protein OUY22_31500 [Nonomuraea sp. MCN248]|uniref:GNAT family N-acetyltransferase n=1 Tax=Nonomuraea corallina TaxID=2989783 RepID=A0ABT4SL42_9ACTN|nr:hypothetical protein [Nonomuraea corallina]MDA0637958.1 hypothetical protein [Nonomuraea corallina]
MSRPRYEARWRGADYPASPESRAEGVWLRLRSRSPLEGFDEVAPGRWVRPVPAADCEQVTYITTVCEWRGVPCVVLGDEDGELLVEYVGGLTPVAADLGFGRIERGVHRRLVPRDEVSGLREEITLLTCV